MLQAYAVVIPYDDHDGTHGPLACTAEIPNDEKGFKKYAKDLRFNRQTENNIFHTRFLSCTPVVNLKLPYYSDIGRVGRITMNLLQNTKLGSNPSSALRLGLLA